MTNLDASGFIFRCQPSGQQCHIADVRAAYFCPSGQVGEVNGVTQRKTGRPDGEQVAFANYSFSGSNYENQFGSRQSQFGQRRVLIALCPGLQGVERLAQRLAGLGVWRANGVDFGERLLDGIAWASRQQAEQVQRTTGFRASARQAFATELLVPTRLRNRLGSR